MARRSTKTEAVETEAVETEAVETEAVETEAVETVDQARAAEKRKAAVAKRTDDPYIPALLAERRGYVVRGLDARVAEVDAALAARGHKD